MHYLCIVLNIVEKKKQKQKKSIMKKKTQGKEMLGRQNKRKLVVMYQDDVFYVSSWNLFPIALLLSLVQLCLSFLYHSFTLTPLQP